MADDAENGLEERDPAELEPVAEEPDQAAGEAQQSLIADVESLVEDGKTYAAAELAFQKTRLLYASDKAKSAAIFTGIAAVFVVMAVVALVLGAVLALTPSLGPLGATALVFVLLLAGAAILVILAKARIRAMLEAFEARDEQA
jgi:uncharacterized membrane protein YqjE